jgi:hypothetical protein
VKELIHVKNNNNDVMIIYKETTAFTPAKEYICNSKFHSSVFTTGTYFARQIWHPCAIVELSYHFQSILFKVKGWRWWFA